MESDRVQIQLAQHMLDQVVDRPLETKYLGTRSTSTVLCEFQHTLYQVVDRPFETRYLGTRSASMNSCDYALIEVISVPCISCAGMYVWWR